MKFLFNLSLQKSVILFYYSFNTIINFNFNFITLSIEEPNLIKFCNKQMFKLKFFIYFRKYLIVIRKI